MKRHLWYTGFCSFSVEARNCDYAETVSLQPARTQNSPRIELFCPWKLQLACAESVKHLCGHGDDQIKNSRSYWRTYSSPLVTSTIYTYTFQFHTHIMNRASGHAHRHLPAFSKDVIWPITSFKTNQYMGGSKIQKTSSHFRVCLIACSS